MLSKLKIHISGKFWEYVLYIISNEAMGTKIKLLYTQQASYKIM